MTYNVRGFYDEQGRNSADSVLRMIRETGPDIVCLQEFNGRLAGDRALLEAVLPGYGCAAGAPDPHAEETGSASALLICSRYPIIRSGDVVGKSGYERHGRSIWADLRIGGDDTRCGFSTTTSIPRPSRPMTTLLSPNTASSRTRPATSGFAASSVVSATTASCVRHRPIRSPGP